MSHSYFRIATMWLLAILVPLQGLPAQRCGCAAEARQAGGADSDRLPPERRAGHCCCKPSSRPTERPAPLHSCCQKAASNIEAKCCRCGPDCRCASSNPRPRPKQLPPQKQRGAEDQTAAPLAIVDQPSDDARAISPEIAGTVPLAPWDRCVLFCRFLL